MPKDSMRIEWWDIDRVIPYENNPRHNDDAVEKVANSLREFGWKQSLVVDSDGVLIVGHTRLKAAQSLGMDKVPVLVASDFTPAQAQAYRIADNASGEIATWNFDLLAVEVDGLQVDFDMEDFGVDMSKLDFGFDVGFEDSQSEPSDAEHSTLREQFGYVPFSVIRGDAAEWLKRKAEWLALGIKSEIGRGGTCFQLQDVPLAEPRIVGD